ncbi:hypothetical protein NA56DRAFT_641474 [Hyaloscypha hepaticicola]|uniref:Uncharacterized protein n=1 Tax=Hyaloscypha hepaticicola TaxID=2082293 RepID=A0A2J6QKM4_9HELO|nr:hypothetical protein NA56DRAFT_641474 [Hyaloscypha hepaticicola]
MSTTTPTAASLTTPAARLAQRDTSNVYLGYYISGTSTSTQYCGPGEIFTTSNTWAGCYQSTQVATPTSLYTNCTSISNPTVYVAGLAICTTESCFTQTVYQTYPNISPMTNFYCAPTGWPATVVYRNIPTDDSGTTSGNVDYFICASFNSTVLICLHSVFINDHNHNLYIIILILPINKFNNHDSYLLLKQQKQSLDRRTCSRRARSHSSSLLRTMVYP